MPCTLNARSMQRLEGVHPDLVKVVLRAAELSDVPFQVTEGLRTLQRQRQLVRQGASRTLKSRHLTGHAIDVVAYVDEKTISWDLPLYKTISAAFKQAAKELEVAIEWGGDWKSFVDSPHFQLAWKQYPADKSFKPIDRTERDLLVAGSRTVKKARLVRQIGQGAVVVGATVKAVVDDPLGATTAVVTSVGQSRELVTTGREQLTWLLQPGNVALGLVVLGLVLAAGAAAIISYRVEDDNTGKHIGRG
ncbi:MAG: M15 family metallopeptidase [Hyphomicrobiaceae bacterium]